MKVAKRSLDLYRSRVDEQADKARAYVRKSLDKWFAANPQATTAQGREFAIELLKASMPNFCDAAGTLAVDFFDEVCEAEGLDGRGELYDTTDWDKVENKVHYFARRLNDEDEEAFKKDVVDATHYFIRRSAHDNMVWNCDKNEVRFARVPTGFETCSFCFMLASRGFVYKTEMTAKGLHGYHLHCDCCIVPGKKGRTEIEGYDPQGMYDRWKACSKSIGEDSEHLGLLASKRVMREVETRDWHWLYTGEPLPPPKKEKGAKPKKKEMETEEMLRPAGYRMLFRKPTGEGRTSDVFFVSGTRSKPVYTQWEMKQSSGDQEARTLGKSNIRNQFKSARGQSRNLIIDVSKVLGFVDTDGAKVDKSYIVKAVDAAMVHHEVAGFFDQALIVFGPNDYVKRFKPKKAAR